MLSSDDKESRQHWASEWSVTLPGQTHFGSASCRKVAGVEGKLAGNGQAAESGTGWFGATLPLTRSLLAMSVPTEPKCDPGAESHLREFHSSLAECGPNLVRLFSRGEYYSALGASALRLASSFLQTSESVRHSAGLASVAISQTRLPALLRHLLVENSYAVEIYARSKARPEWHLESQASPGSLGPLEDMLCRENGAVPSQVTAAASVGEDGQVALCALDLVQCRLHLAAFADHASLPLLESLLVRLAPQQCLLAHPSPRADALLARHAILGRTVETSQSAEESLSALRHLLRPEHLASLERLVESSPQVLSPAASLLAHLRPQAEPLSAGQYSLSEAPPDHFARLDLASVRNLNLFAGEGSGVRSLLCLLDHCRSVSGKKTLEHWMRHPLTQPALIDHRLDLVEFFVQRASLASCLRDRHLSRVADISRVYSKFARGRVKLKDLYAVCQCIGAMRRAVGELARSDPTPAVQRALVDSNQALVDGLGPLEATVTDRVVSLSGHLLLRHSAHPRLASLFGHFKQLHLAASEEHDLICADLFSRFGLERDSIRLEKDKSAYSVRVCRQQQPRLAQCAHYHLLASNSVKETRFVSRGLAQINRRVGGLVEEYESAQSEHVQRLVRECRQWCPLVQSLESSLASLDALLSLAHAARTSPQPYTRPRVLAMGSDRLELVQFRHPIIEARQCGSFVANDIDLAGRKVAVVTGPNMGGKSTLIRSVALCVLMAQMGSFVPCERATVTAVDALYTRMSAADDPLRGLSTFMAEMSETSSILHALSPHSLLVIDELGRSTSTFDGFGIAQAITAHLATAARPFALFATHFHEMGRTLAQVGQLRMKVSVEGGRCVSHFLAEQGTASRSFGLELAATAHLPPSLLLSARRKLHWMEDSTGDHARVRTLVRRLAQQEGEGEEPLSPLSLRERLAHTDLECL